MIGRLGDRPVDTYSSSDVADYRAWLLGQNPTTSSIKRMFRTTQAVFMLMIREHGFGCKNLFSGSYLGPVDEAKRASLLNEDKKYLQT